ncbi:MAG: AAA family ATPase [Planctomycetota bacterium]|nr:AAA family ATPase [Planctomycetota bacterium]
MLHEEPNAVTKPDAREPLPEWYPGWARELADLYFSGTTSMFVLHGNVHDLIECPGENSTRYCSLSEFLAEQLFGKWDIVLSYDLSRGLRALAGSDSRRLQQMMQSLTSRWGEPLTWPREPDKVLLGLDAFVERNLIEEPAQRKSVSLVFDYAQYLVPAGDLDSLSRGNGSRLVRFLHWAQNPHIKRVNNCFCLIADKLSEINDRLLHSPHVATIEISLPDQKVREHYIQHSTKDEDIKRLTDFTVEQLAKLSNGLSLTNLNVILAQAARTSRRLDSKRFRQLKKSMIERQCQGLVEFVEPGHTLDLVIGHDTAIERLKQDAAAIQKGESETAPMGYLICGPVGTGKTFLAECYAGSVGIPCVSLRNFRSKYVGETEGNLEQVLTVLRSLGPVLVIVDEADATLGNRQSSGDSGTSARVFSMIASQMGNTRYRGQIIWMLLTSRPDLLPIDLKRQGRAEVHIPLFYPHDEASVHAMFLAMAKKSKIPLKPEDVPAVDLKRKLSGADIESIVLSAKRQSFTAGRSDITKADLEQSLAEFIPSAQGLEKELQDLAAVLECTQLSFLPDEWREKVQKPDGRSRLQERMVAIRQLLEDG